MKLNKGSDEGGRVSSQNQLWVQYLKSSIFLLLLLTVFVSIFNFWVNPYNLFCEDCSEPRQAESTNQRAFKMFDLIRYHPKQLLLGTSRVDYGVNGKDLKPLPFYNGGLSDASITEMYSLLQSANVITGLEKVVLFLDISSFDEASNNGTEKFRLDLGQSVNELKLWSYFGIETTRSIVSLDAVLASIDVLMTRDQRCTGTRVYGQAQGQDKACHATQAGRYDAFMEAAHSLASKYGREGDDHLQLGLTVFESILEYCRINAIDLQIVFPPVHEEVLRISRSLSSAPVFPGWKVSIEQRIEISSKKPWKSVLQLKDLTSIPGVTDEAVGENMQYWWEASHFKPEVKLQL
ncbi:hypothetical protein [Neptunomonas antarctica]|uniref:Uncharacterized protein n=1 Tax=Neptunomonas antarctica TaxID=619304 RepID=A0A1N7JEK4_9GAMM|nr:hypothetical protein [Neptunomonas antarctica]SIS47793.1 hypothetical protein SAMN05421760_1011038 [Neptunomonas antarctica]